MKKIRCYGKRPLVKNNNYHVLEKELFHNKPNNRWGESYKILADILYGEQ